jgi:AcrR family transcriptional regulator
VEGLTLREITPAAQANVAAVSYHFGSLRALCHAAIEQALATMIDEQIARLRALGDDPSLDEIAAALAHPVIAAISDAGCSEQSFLRIVARVTNRPPCELEDWMAAAIARADEEILIHLRRALPGVPDRDLRFRVECAVGLLHFLASGSMRVDLEPNNAAELERLFVPVISGALAAGAPAA